MGKGVQKVRKKKSFALVILLVVTLILSACTDFTTKDSPQGEQVLNLTEPQEPSNLDSVFAAEVASINVLNNVMEGLMRLDQDDHPVPGIAERYEVSDDKLTYTFFLREAKWSDGKPVKASDFQYAWLRALNPETQSQYANILFPIANAQEYNEKKVKAKDVGIKVLDEKTLEVKLKSPSPYFLGLTSFVTYYPQRKDVVEKHGKKYASEVDKMVYNGPFVLSEWERHQRLTLKKNEEYWGKHSVKLEDVNIYITKSTATGVNRFNSGEVDSAMVDQAFTQAFKQTPAYTPVTMAGTQYIQFNLKENQFVSSTKIRKALSLAIDRESLTDQVLQNGSSPAGAFVPPAIQGMDNKAFRELEGVAVNYHIFDPEQAKKLMKEGMKELGINKQPTDLQLLIADDELTKKTAVYIQDQWRDHLGFKVKINPVPRKERINREQKGNFQMSLSGWLGDYNDPMSFLEMWMGGAPFNFGGWSNKEYDKLIKKSMENTNFEERMRDLVEAEKILLEQEAVIAPLYYHGEAYIQKPYVRELIRHPVGPGYTLKWTYIDKREENN